MSADNRILVHQHTDYMWYVWHASCSEEYSGPPNGTTAVFNEEDEVWEWARKEADNCTILEGGVQLLTKLEQISALRREIEEFKNPVYCSECSACGEDPCCSGAMCKRNQCLYGERYSKDYRYNTHLVNRLYEVASKHDLKLTEAIQSATFDEVYNNKEYTLK